MNPRQSSLFSLIALIIMMLTGCSDSENELTIKKLTTEKSSLNIQLLKAKNDINHIKNSYVDLLVIYNILYSKVQNRSFDSNNILAC